jgi:hypothetical protein
MRSSVPFARADLERAKTDGEILVLRVPRDPDGPLTMLALSKRLSGGLDPKVHTASATAARRMDRPAVRHRGHVRHRWWLVRAPLPNDAEPRPSRPGRRPGRARPRPRARAGGRSRVRHPRIQRARRTARRGQGLVAEQRPERRPRRVRRAWPRRHRVRFGTAASAPNATSTQDYVLGRGKRASVTATRDRDAAASKAGAAQAVRAPNVRLGDPCSVLAARKTGAPTHYFV